MVHVRAGWFKCPWRLCSQLAHWRRKLNTKLVNFYFFFFISFTTSPLFSLLSPSFSISFFLLVSLLCLYLSFMKQAGDYWTWVLWLCCWSIIQWESISSGNTHNRALINFIHIVHTIQYKSACCGGFQLVLVSCLVQTRQHLCVCACVTSRHSVCACSSLFECVRNITLVTVSPWS